jgi:hypothetical protein
MSLPCHIIYLFLVKIYRVLDYASEGNCKEECNWSGTRLPHKQPAEARHELDYMSIILSK